MRGWEHKNLGRIRYVPLSARETGRGPDRARWNGEHRMTERERPTAADRERASNARRDRALELPLDVRVRPDRRFVRLEVRNPARRTRYDVLFPAYPDRANGFCTCPDFARRGLGTCKHLESGWLWLEEHGAPQGPEGEPPSERSVWEEIDRRARAAPRLDRPWPRRIRYAGTALTAVRPVRDLPS